MTETYPSYIDKQDAAVIDQLEVGDVCGASYIKSLYETHTEIDREITAKKRKDNLVQKPCFDYIYIDVFEFVGWSDE